MGDFLVNIVISVNQLQILFWVAFVLRGEYLGESCLIHPALWDKRTEFEIDLFHASISQIFMSSIRLVTSQITNG